MNVVSMNFENNERRDEFFALINMIGYAVSIAHTLGSQTAAEHMDTARAALIKQLQDEMSSNLSADNINRIATVRAGHC
ncbi:hypothetical protein [Rhizobium sp. FKY42]|uniref:hypothetical protein n=1 Tax=Rhizobium sp. FKY42 TaxID=2562310 RepID=UPI0010BFA4A8|nr:hypothetical protein [Rhizobium sp. FKY42]